MELELNGWLIDIRSGDGWKIIGFIEEEQLKRDIFHDFYTAFSFYLDDISELLDKKGNTLKVYRINEEFLIKKWDLKGNFVHVIGPRNNIRIVRD
ncbi:hypothetical protein V7157_28630 [Neobacillus drentensis]|uniref:hypothetical protein n=1 Tax=Neobacillus drentensis TaxID=220684 RepID=UPI003003162B